ncbi:MULTISPECIES: pyridoxamine 5'-phosphate oxidase family protein [Cyanophyceae]|uniref:pyridoxamine 5'-phosphate oxidase family protein n=1 Tax=Cyanophyceae TaxID=3028117 RepID=UPI001682DFAA|nr:MULTISPECIES: pyridoxamine 5'-phosphate oxidase family protein [Cyanophyceae]MBD1914848.1 pyridoxamine 5'-phosphate oxidase family protein [Phormidium sp. FACHB-77]MBD2031012.1 pyridoxamine 5'-phosphate oxidase family protein [Phormidium sp. FACHB-322]MBD2052619.1 pyridoxamine 5'-phosphate oxidase family protein [Leptolyngbya sp. FACHB-60]
MTNLGWPHDGSPFHAGELAIQTRLGVQERMNRQGRRIIRDYLPDQHREFFAQLSYLLVGTVASDGQPWASILVGEPGFITSPDPHTLHIAAQPLFADPLHTTLAVGADIGLLGIELHTRRRNRLNGTITNIQPEGFTVAVGQSFGNCPQYIQARQFDLQSFDAAVAKPVHALAMLGDAERAMIAAADTFFIATAHQDASAGSASGVDVSHRGGKPGFVRIDDSQTLTIPDFSGNLHFNTFGNLELNPRAGLVFIDFDRGDLLYLSGTAEVIWDGPEIVAYEGAERLLRFYIKQGYRVEGSLPLAWSTPEVSPFLNDTGPWRSQA